MKKLIRSSITKNNSEAEARMGELINLGYNAGYDVTVDAEYNVTVTPHKDDKFMAQFNVETVHDGNNIYFQTDMSFPTIKHDDVEFHDSYHYYVKGYLAATEIADWLFRKEIDLTEEYED